ncbi:MAG: hypothetical protein AAF581_11595 [Planctomycetota bacterium]
MNNPDFVTFHLGRLTADATVEMECDPPLNHPAPELYEPCAESYRVGWVHGTRRVDNEILSWSNYPEWVSSCKSYHKPEPTWNNLLDWSQPNPLPYQEWPWYLNSPSYAPVPINCRENPTNELYTFTDKPWMEHLLNEVRCVEEYYNDMKMQLAIVAQCEGLEDKYHIVAQAPVEYFAHFTMYETAPSQELWAWLYDEYLPESPEIVWSTYGSTDVGAWLYYDHNTNLCCNLEMGNQSITLHNAIESGTQVSEECPHDW